MRRSLLPVVLLAVLAFVPGLGRGAIADTDEAFYAESAREMVESGDWLTPYFNYEPRFQKPALYYWLTAGVFRLAGPTEFAARLWSALAGIGLVMVTALCGRRWFDDATGLLAGAIAATSFGYFALARMALPDLPLAFFITLTIVAAFAATLERERSPRTWLLVAALAAAGGFLMKGPLALVIPALVVIPTLLLERRSFNLRAGDLATAVLAFVLVAAPWYVAMWSQHGNAYLEGFFIGDNVERFATSRFNDPRPWWFYLPVIAGGLLPWTPLALVWVGPILQWLGRRRDLGTLELRLLLWAMLPLIFFTLSIGKQPRYVLPVLPPLAILLAGSILERSNEWRSRDGVRRRAGPNRAVVAGSALAGGVLVALAVLLARAQPLFLDVPPALATGVAIVVGVAGAAVIVASLSPGWRLAPLLLAPATAVAFAALPFGTLAAPADSSVVRMAGLVRDAQGADEAVGTYKVFVRNLVFYTGTPHTDLIHDEHLLEWIGKHPGALIVMYAADAERLVRERGLALQHLAELPYFNDGALRVGTMLWPNPATDIDTVVIVRVLD